MARKVKSTTWVKILRLLYTVHFHFVQNLLFPEYMFENVMMIYDHPVFQTFLTATFLQKHYLKKLLILHASTTIHHFGTFKYGSLRLITSRIRHVITECKKLICTALGWRPLVKTLNQVSYKSVNGFTRSQRRRNSDLISLFFFFNSRKVTRLQNKGSWS
jgi:hypothetical protein